MNIKPPLDGCINFLFYTKSGLASCLGSELCELVGLAGTSRNQEGGPRSITHSSLNMLVTVHHYILSEDLAATTLK